MLQPVPAGEGESLGKEHTSLVPGTQLGWRRRTGIVYVINVMDGHLGLQSTDLRQSARQNVTGLHKKQTLH